MNSDSLNMVSRLGEGHMSGTFFLSEPQLKTTVLSIELEKNKSQILFDRPLLPKGSATIIESDLKKKLWRILSKVLFIFRCSKNWQKKSAGNHLLSK